MPRRLQISCVPTDLNLHAHPEQGYDPQNHRRDTSRALDVSRHRDVCAKERSKSDKQNKNGRPKDCRAVHAFNDVYAPSLNKCAIVGVSPRVQDRRPHLLGQAIQPSSLGRQDISVQVAIVQVVNEGIAGHWHGALRPHWTRDIVISLGLDIVLRRVRFVFLKDMNLVPLLKSKVDEAHGFGPQAKATVHPPTSHITVVFSYPAEELDVPGKSRDVDFTQTLT